MDTTVSGIGAVVVAELRATGYMESGGWSVREEDQGAD